MIHCFWTLAYNIIGPLICAKGITKYTVHDIDFLTLPLYRNCDVLEIYFFAPSLRSRYFGLTFISSFSKACHLLFTEAGIWTDT